jgi:hypothetical protein
MFMYKKLLTISLVLWSVAIYAEAKQSNSQCDHLQVSVLPSNKVLLFGVETKLDELSIELKRAAENSGSVLYYRERADGSSLAIEAKIIQLVLDNQLPIMMSSQADFSDLLYASGNLKPR